MSDRPYDGRERREHPRFPMEVAVEVQVAIPGESPARIRGRTINVSCGGLLADLGIKVKAGSRCRVIFENVGGRIEPRQRLGKVIHVGTWTHGHYAVAVQFDEPLTELAPPD